MNTNYAQQVVNITLRNFDDVAKIKLLDQKERKFIIEAFRYLNRQDRDPYDSEYLLNENKIESLKKRLFEKAKLPPKTEHSNFIISFFKGLANRLFGRVTAEQVYKEIHKTNPSIQL